MNLFIETPSDELSKDEKTAAAGGLELKRKVGLFSAVVLIVGNMIGNRDINKDIPIK